MSITLTPGRLALRKPELGGFLMVEVEEVLTHHTRTCIRWSGMTEWADRFLPVLRPGDVVPAGSLLYEIRQTGACPMECYDEYTASSAFMVALLRYGPEEDA